MKHIKLFENFSEEGTFRNEFTEPGGPSISMMSREDMIEFLGTTEEAVKDMTDEELRNAVEDKNSSLM